MVYTVMIDKQPPGAGDVLAALRGRYSYKSVKMSLNFCMEKSTFSCHSSGLLLLSDYVHNSVISSLAVMEKDIFSL